MLFSPSCMQRQTAVTTYFSSEQLRLFLYLHDISSYSSMSISIHLRRVPVCGSGSRTDPTSDPGGHSLPFTVQIERRDPENAPAVLPDIPRNWRQTGRKCRLKRAERTLRRRRRRHNQTLAQYVAQQGPREWMWCFLTFACAEWRLFCRAVLVILYDGDLRVLSVS